MTKTRIMQISNDLSEGSIQATVTKRELMGVAKYWQNKASLLAELLEAERSRPPEGMWLRGTPIQ